MAVLGYSRVVLSSSETQTSHLESRVKQITRDRGMWTYWSMDEVSGVRGLRISYSIAEVSKRRIS